MGIESACGIPIGTAEAANQAKGFSCQFEDIHDDGVLARTKRERSAAISAVCKERTTTPGPGNSHGSRLDQASIKNLAMNFSAFQSARKIWDRNRNKHRKPPNSNTAHTT